MASRRFSDNSINRSFSCELCNERVRSSDEMRTHLRTCANKTDKCPRCNQYIPRGNFNYHVNHNCVNVDQFEEERNTTSSIRRHLNRHVHSTNDQTKPEVPKKFDALLDKATHIQEALNEHYYPSEIEHVVEKLQFSIIVMGSPRVGKSQLINALCNGKNRAETSLSLDSCTKDITPYVLEGNPQQNPNLKPFKIIFYDTPGIESWGNQAGEKNMIEFIKKTDPICVIYCASPGSFAKLDQLHSVLELCKTKEIFCALVCTNMWSGNQRETVINEFQKELAFFGDKIEKFSKQPNSQTQHKVTFFGKGALCTMVNSIEYYDPDFSPERKPVQGVDELIHGIMEALDHDKLLGWCYAVLYRRSYWEKISQKLGGFFSLRLADLYKLVTPSADGTATNFLSYFTDWFYKKKT